MCNYSNKTSNGNSNKSREKGGRIGGGDNKRTDLASFVKQDQVRQETLTVMNFFNHTDISYMTK